MYVALEAAGRVTAALCIAVGSVTPTGVVATPPPCTAPTCTPATTALDPVSAADSTTQSAAGGTGTTLTTIPAAPVTTTPAVSSSSSAVSAGTPTTTASPHSSTSASSSASSSTAGTTTTSSTSSSAEPTTTSADPVAPPVTDPPGGTGSADYQAGYDAGYSAGFAAGRAAAAGGTGTGTVPAAPSATGTETSAAARFGWGTPTRVDDFTGGLGQWGVYNGVGHGGNGRRSPGAVTTQNGVLTIAGDANGTTGGMSWGPGAKYGRWEVRVQAPVSDPSYHAVALLWPDAENWPVGGEVDFMEMMDASRQVTNMFLHYGASNSQVSGSVRIDATQWHDWAVEWTPDHIAAFVDGQEWWRTTTTSILPPGPMHLTLQLDWFPQGGSVRPSAMHVDRVAYYPV